MKVIFSPTKTMNKEMLTSNRINVHSAYYKKKLNYLLNNGYEIDLEKSCIAVKLYSGISFKQLNNLDDNFYNDLIILSSLYGFSFGHDYINCYRLDYTTSDGRYLRKEFYEEINDLLADEDIVYNLASLEYSKGITHKNMIEFEFLVEKDDRLKNISATSKKMRGCMVEYIRTNGGKNLELFNCNGFVFCEKLSTSCKYVYVLKQVF